METEILDSQDKKCVLTIRGCPSRYAMGVIGFLNSEADIDNDAVIVLMDNSECYIGNDSLYISNKVNVQRNFIGREEKFLGSDSSGVAVAVYSADDDSLSFYYCQNVPEIGKKFYGKTVTNVYTGFETDVYTNVTSVPWYSYREDIKSVLFDSSFKNVKPISTAFWFAYMSNCESINLTYLDTSSVTQMQQMFRSCTSLTSLDLSMFDMNKVERIANMCLQDTNLKTIDLCGWETGSILYMASIFMNCTSLTTIYADRDFKISSDLQNDAGMFDNCTSLVGGNGTKYDSSKVDSNMARIDTVDNPGYFTSI